MKFIFLRINTLFICLIITSLVTVSIITLMAVSPTGMLQENVAYSLQPELTFSFENSTHFQTNSDRPITLKSPVYFTVELVKDPEGYAFNGDLYKPSHNTIFFMFNDEGKFKSYLYNLTNSGNNEVIFSDTQIEPKFTYRMPLSANTTTESIQKIDLSFDVDTIERLVDGVKYIAGTDSPLVINDTAYLFPYAVFNQFNDGTATISISSDNPPVRNDPELLSNLMQLFN